VLLKKLYKPVICTDSEVTLRLPRFEAFLSSPIKQFASPPDYEYSGEIDLLGLEESHEGANHLQQLMLMRTTPVEPVVYLLYGDVKVTRERVVAVEEPAPWTLEFQESQIVITGISINEGEVSTEVLTQGKLAHDLCTTGCTEVYQKVSVGLKETLNLTFRWIGVDQVSKVGK
jgi:hypothetical protein